MTRFSPLGPLACFVTLLLLGSSVVLAAPTTAPGGTVVESEPVQLDVGQCSASDLGLPVSVVDSIQTRVIAFCPVDGSICLDSDVCRAGCRTCGIEIGVCIWGICRCLDT